MKDKELVAYDSTGRTLQIRDDVSQLNMQSGKVQILVQDGRIPKEIIDISGPWNSDRDFISKRDEIVAIVKQSAWYRNHSPSSESPGLALHDIVESIEISRDITEFFAPWESLVTEAKHEYIQIVPEG